MLSSICLNSARQPHAVTSRLLKLTANPSPFSTEPAMTHPLSY